MPFSSNDQLPEPVRNSLNESDQTKWREVFNSALSGTCAGDDGCAARVAWSAVKKNARWFAGFASTDALDKQGDVVEPEAFKQTMGRYMAQGGLLIDKHSNRKVGAVIDWCFKEAGEKKGLWVEGVIYRQYKVQDEVWEKILRGEYEAFSIGGDPIKVGQVCDAEKCWNTIKDLELFEISVVDKPANPEATIEAKTLAKGDNGATDTFISNPTTSQGSPMVEKAMEGRLEKSSCSPLACLKLAEVDIAKIVEHLKGGCTIEQKKAEAGAVGPEAAVKEGPAPPTGGVDLKAVMEKLATLEAALMQHMKAEDEGEGCGDEEEMKPQEEMKADKDAKLLEAKVASAVKMEMAKLAQAQEAATKRPSLEKHEPEDDKIMKVLKDRDALREMSMREVVELAFATERGR